MFRHGTHSTIIITTSRLLEAGEHNKKPFHLLKRDKKGLTSLFGQLVEEFATRLDNTTHASLKLVSRLTTGDLVHCA